MKQICLVLCSVPIHMEVLGLDELMCLARGHSLNTPLPGKICRGAFRPSAFLIKPTWEIHALGQVAVAQFTYCNVYGCFEATGGGKEILGTHLSRKLHPAGLVECRALVRVSWSQLLHRGAHCPAAPLCAYSHTISTQCCLGRRRCCQCQLYVMVMSCEEQYPNCQV